MNGVGVLRPPMPGLPPIRPHTHGAGQLPPTFGGCTTTMESNTALSGCFSSDARVLRAVSASAGACCVCNATSESSACFAATALSAADAERLPPHAAISNDTPNTNAGCRIQARRYWQNCPRVLGPPAENGAGLRGNGWSRCAACQANAARTAELNIMSSGCRRSYTSWLVWCVRDP